MRKFWLSSEKLFILFWWILIIFMKKLSCDLCNKKIHNICVKFRWLGWAENRSIENIVHSNNASMKLNTCFEEIQQNAILLISKSIVDIWNNIEQCQRKNEVISLNVFLLRIKSFFTLFHSFEGNQRKIKRKVQKVSNVSIFNFMNDKINN
jgi:hypothetical protein